MDRYQYYIGVLQARDQALVVVAGLVLSGMLWWGLLERWPRLRRWGAWGFVVLYCLFMLAFVLGGGGNAG